MYWMRGLAGESKSAIAEMMSWEPKCLDTVFFVTVEGYNLPSRLSLSHLPIIVLLLARGSMGRLFSTRRYYRSLLNRSRSYRSRDREEIFINGSDMCADKDA